LFRRTKGGVQYITHDVFTGGESWSEDNVTIVCVCDLEKCVKKKPNNVQKEVYVEYLRNKAGKWPSDKDWPGLPKYAYKKANDIPTMAGRLWEKVGNEWRKRAGA